MLSCERRVLQKTCEDGEHFELWVEPRHHALVFGEDSQGPITKLAFGEEWHRCLVEVDNETLTCAFVNSTVEGFLRQSDAPLCDLMDLLDFKGLPYSYVCLGSSSTVSYRASAGGPASRRQIMDFSQMLDV